MSRGRPRKVIELREAPVLDAEAVEVLVDMLDLVYNRILPMQDKVSEIRQEIEQYTDNTQAAWASRFCDELFGNVVAALGYAEQAQEWLRKGVS